MLTRNNIFNAWKSEEKSSTPILSNVAFLMYGVFFLNIISHFASVEASSSCEAPDGLIDTTEINGSNGFTAQFEPHPLTGIAIYPVSYVGDINHDGFDDVAMGDVDQDQYYVVFGSSQVGSSGSVDLTHLNGVNGFRIYGVPGTYTRASIRMAGDINGDGIDDMMIGAWWANFGDGATYILYGDPNIGSNGIFDLDDLNGINGFSIPGITSGGELGAALANLGDINGDHIDDIAIAAPNAASIGHVYAGDVYVLFGGVNISSSSEFHLNNLDGSNGFVIHGSSTWSYLGIDVSSAGDFNHDGINDLLIGSIEASMNTAISSKGKAYIVYGDANIGNTGVIDLNDLDGSNGFSVTGESAYDYFSYAVSFAGDVNGDEIDDVIFGAFRTDANGQFHSGSSYLLFGGQGIGNAGFFDLSELDGSNGVAIYGVDVQDGLGLTVSNAGDFNQDGFDDVIIGNNYIIQENKGSAAYVVFGNTTLGHNGVFMLSDLNGYNGFAIRFINSATIFPAVGFAGDVNGDGFSDVIVSVSYYVQNGMGVSGFATVLFGTANPLIARPIPCPTPAPSMMTNSPTYQQENNHHFQTITPLLYSRYAGSGAGGGYYNQIQPQTQSLSQNSFFNQNEQKKKTSPLKSDCQKLSCNELKYFSECQYYFNKKKCGDNQVKASKSKEKIVSKKISTSSTLADIQERFGL